MTMRRRRCGWAAAVLLAGVAAAVQAAEPAMQVTGQGVQIYECTGEAWKLKGPDAVLTDAAGTQVGTHFAGPTWKAADGSEVVGEPVVTSVAPEPGAVPWLVLRAASHKGSGVFLRVAYVVRTATSGGAAPREGCDAGHKGAEARVAYRATYTLFPD